MRDLVNTLMTRLSAWWNGRIKLRDSSRRRIYASGFIMQVSGVASKGWELRRRGKSA